MKQIKVQTLYGYELDADIGEEGVTIQQFIAIYDKTIETAKRLYDCVEGSFLIVMERDYDVREMLLKFQRYETDIEYELRLKIEKQAEINRKKFMEDQDKKELATLKKLAKKYGKKLV